MIQLELSEEEKGILEEVLESSLSDLRMEIGNTDSLDYRNILKVRKGVIEKTLRAIR